MTSKFTMNIGPGNTIGAMAFGNGAKAEGVLHVGGTASSGPPDKVKASIEIKGASPERAAKWLRMMADAVEGDYCPTFAKTSEKEPGASVAWSWEADK